MYHVDLSLEGCGSVWSIQGPRKMQISIHLRSSGKLKITYVLELFGYFITINVVRDRNEIPNLLILTA
jgi:hypothetical protein